MLEEIYALNASGMAVDETADRIKKKVNLSQELIRYIARTRAAASS